MIALPKAVELELGTEAEAWQLAVLWRGRVVAEPLGGAVTNTGEGRQQLIELLSDSLQEIDEHGGRFVILPVSGCH